MKARRPHSRVERPGHVRCAKVAPRISSAWLSAAKNRPTKIHCVSAGLGIRLECGLAFFLRKIVRVAIVPSAHP